MPAGPHSDMSADLRTTRVPQLPDKGGHALARYVTLLRQPLLWIFLAALATRLYNLTFHSFWFDEAMSTFWAARPADEIWRVGLALTQDKHPPLYYLLLRGWTALFGAGDYAVRSLGALIGALAVFPAHGIGLRLGGRRAGALGALLLALNPFLVWYSQEVRMFMPATTFGLIGLYGVVLIGENGTHHRSSLVGVVLAILGTAAALYSYLYSAFLLPVAGLWILLSWWLMRGELGAARRFWLGVLALAIVALLFLPLARSAWQVSGAEAAPGQAFAGLGAVLPRLFKVYTLGWVRWPASWLTPLLTAAALVILTGCLWLPKQKDDARVRRWGGLFLALWPGAILFVGGILLSRDGRVFAETRYQIALVPALCLLAGRGLAALIPSGGRLRWAWRTLIGLVSMALVLGITLAALPADWAPENRREAWREAAAFVKAHSGPNDAILIYIDYVGIAFDRYFDGPQAEFAPFTDRLTDPMAIDPPLAGMADYDAVWIVESHHQDLDPNNLLPGWFAARYPLITEVFPKGISVRAYAQHYRPDELPTGIPRIDVAMGDIRLLGCRYQPDALSAVDDLLHPPSGWVHVTTYWTLPGLAPPSKNIYPSVRLVDSAGQIWGDKLERSNDAIHVWPTSRWVPDEIVRVDYDVNLNPITPAGRYQLAVEIPDAGARVMCGEVTITR